MAIAPKATTADLISSFESSTHAKHPTTSTSNLGFTAGLFDELGLEDLINKAIGKEGSHVKADCGCIVKCLTMQVLNAPYQSLSGIQEFFESKPLCVFTQQSLGADDLNRHVLGRALDAFYDYGCENLFLKCSAQVAKVLDLKVTSTHIDTTSLHYDGESYPQEDCDVILTKGYSRDHRPELNQIISLMMCDTLSKIPLYQKAISGNVNDNKSFNHVIRFAIDTMRQQFKDLKYLVGDSALCTAENLNSAKEKHLHLISRIPDQNIAAKECYQEVLNHPELLESVNPEDPQCETRGAWFSDVTIDGVAVKRLLINNELLKDKKTATIKKRAQRELEKTTTAIKKLSTKPCKCLADAQKQIESIIKSSPRCLLTNIRYEDVFKNPHRGKLKDGESQTLVAVKAFADVSINDKYIADEITQELMMVLTTTDVERQWTMFELLSLYKKQSTVERNWKMLKDSRILINSIFLKKPSRITALLWLMSIALLVYCAGEYRLRKVMAEQKLTIPSLDHSSRQKQPTMIRFLTYLDNQGIQMIYDSSGKAYVENFPDDLKLIIGNLGANIAYYYQPRNYADYLLLGD